MINKLKQQIKKMRPDEIKVLSGMSGVDERTILKFISEELTRPSTYIKIKNGYDKLNQFSNI